MTEPKQVIVIRKDLKMRKGKMAAQAAHASMKAVLDYGHWDSASTMKIIGMPKPMTEWLNGSFTKICVSVDSEEELVEIFNKAKSKNMPCSLITDSGRTEFGGIPTKTAVAVGPYYSDIVNQITGKLKLL